MPNKPLFRNIWFWVTIFLVFFILGSKVNYAHKNNLSTEIQQSGSSTTSISEKASTSIVTSIPADQASQQQTYEYGNAQVTQMVNKALASGQAVKALDYGDPPHPKQTGVIVGNKLLVALDGYRVTAESYPYRVYLVVDFEECNLSLEPYYSSTDSFTLIDNNGLGYNYSPSYGADVTGDIAGKVDFNNIRRGEIAFELPTRNRPIDTPNYLLKFDTGLSAPSYIEFTVNLREAA